MRGMVARHALLIRTMPQNIAQDIASQIATRQMRGERAETIAASIYERIPEITASRIAMLARTEVGSTATAISRARSENLGLPCYEWLSSEDVRVRPSHRKMDHVLVLWSDPPAPEMLAHVKSRLGHYHAGQAPGCRCDANVIVDLDQVDWPHKVYSRGSITRMGRARFLKLIHP
jgi:SPP1 gp7 family putative phage head morphogenesis protein